MYHAKVLNLESERRRLERAGVRLMMFITAVPTRVCLAHIEEPDDVLLELVKPAWLRMPGWY